MAEPRTNPRRPPRLDWTGLEWKLALTTLLAGAYALLWLGLQPQQAEASDTTDDSGPSASTAADERAGAARWLQELPPSAREALVPPPGYRFATLEPGVAATTARPAARPTRVTRPARVRTRSS